MSTDIPENAKASEDFTENAAPPADEPKGYGHPPKDHKWKKGCVSPNPRGRPRKRERSLTPRQRRRDFLSISESLTTIKTEKGTKQVTTREACFLRLRNKALSGHGPSLRLFLLLDSEALREHNEIHDEHFRKLEQVEKMVVFDPKIEASESAFNYINGMRKFTRRT